SRLFPGLPVEENLYLGIVGRDGGHLRPIRTSKDAEYRARARAAAERVWLDANLPAMVGAPPHGRPRQRGVGMAIAVEPGLMMLDEPASGLSRGERERLTELLM